MTVQTSIDMNKYYKQMRDPDSDYAAYEIERICRLLEENHTIQVPIGSEDFFFEPILENMSCGNANVTSVVFKAVFLLVLYFPSSKYDYLLRRMLEIASEDDCNIRIQILSVFKEVLHKFCDFSQEKSKHIYDCLFPTLSRDILSWKDDKLSFVINLLALLIQYGGRYSSEEDISQVLSKIFAFIGPSSTKERVSQISYIFDLIKFWSIAAKKVHIDAFIGFLRSNIYNDYYIPVMSLNAALTSNPKGFRNHIVFVYDYLEKAIERIDNELDNGDNIFLANNDNHIPLMQSSFASMSMLVLKYPNEIESHVFTLLKYSFKYIDYGIIINMSSIGDSDDFNSENEMNNDNSENRDSDDDSVSNEKDESWRLRVSSAMVIDSLVERFPQQFIEVFLSDEYHSSITNSIYDSDPLSKNQVLELIFHIVQSYHRKLSGLLIEWLEIIIKQLTNQYTLVLLSTLKLVSIIIPYSSIDESLLSIIVNCVFSCYCKETSEFINVVIYNILKHQTTSTIVIRSILQFLSNNLISFCVDNSTKNCDTIIYLFYTIYQNDMEKDTFESLSIINDLMIKAEKKDFSRMISIVSVFICLFSNTIECEILLDLFFAEISTQTPTKHIIDSFLMLVRSKAKNNLSKKIDLIENIIFSYIYFNEPEILNVTLSLIQNMNFEGLFDYSKQNSIISLLCNNYPSFSLSNQSLSLTIMGSFSVSEDKQLLIIQTAVSCIISDSIIPNIIDLLSLFSQKNSKIQQQVLDYILIISSQTEQESQFYGILFGQIVSRNNGSINNYFEKIKPLSVESACPFDVLAWANMIQFMSPENSNQIIDVIFKIMKLLDRTVLVSASSKALGHIMSRATSANISTIREEYLKQAGNYSIWLNIIESFLDSCLINKLECNNETGLLVFDDILKTKLSDDLNSLLSKCLYKFTLLDSKYIYRLANSICPPNDYAVSFAIYTFVLSCSDEKIIESLLPCLIPSFNSCNPSLISNLIQILISSFRFNSLHEKLFGFYKKIITRISFSVDQILKTQIGVNTIETDTGINMRKSALKATLLFIKECHSLIDDGDIPLFIESLLDPSIEVYHEAISLLISCILIKPTKFSIYLSHIHDSLRTISQNDELFSKDENVLPFLQLIITLKSQLGDETVVKTLYREFKNNHLFQEAMNLHTESLNKQLSISNEISVFELVKSKIIHKNGKNE